MMPVLAKLHESIDDLKSPGDFMFTANSNSGDQPAGIIFVCPCGCGTKGYLAIDGPHLTADDARHPRWTWNGVRDKPTFTPSIQRMSDCKWHGYLTDGVFSSC